MSKSTEQPTSTDHPDEAIEREIGHDEFNPIGAAVLVLIYFVIVALMWVFMYFVEFLGNGPTVV